MYFFICFALYVIICNAQAQNELNRNSVCKVRNGYIPVSGNCDAYIECKEYFAADMQCPDGLYFDPNAQWPIYPCGYPQDVSCVGGSIIQPANPTAVCPHQYGFYPAPQAKGNDCGHYRMCVKGHAIEMNCPPGLAFNPTEAHCDWPDNVPTCNSNDFLGFTCPAAAIDTDGNPIVTNHKLVDNCYAFYSCWNGNARILSCDFGFAFDAKLGRCENADKVVCDPPGIIMAADQKKIY